MPETKRDLGSESSVPRRTLEQYLDATPPGLHRVDGWDELIPVGVESGAETAEEVPEDPR